MALYDSEMSLQAIGDALELNPIKVRKLLITAGVYESDVAEKVKTPLRNTEKYKTIKLHCYQPQQPLNLSKASVTSYLPYQKGVYFPSTEKEKISVGAERQRRYRAMKRWRSESDRRKLLGCGCGLCWCEIQNLLRVAILLRNKKRQEWRVHKRAVDR